MQEISIQFNKFYHALLNEAFKKARQISFRDWRDTNTGGCLIFYRLEDYEDMDDLKQIFKLMNLNYAVDGDKKLSTNKIENKELCRHIEYITKILNENAIEFDHDLEKWERLKQEAGINE